MDRGGVAREYLVREGAGGGVPDVDFSCPISRCEACPTSGEDEGGCLMVVVKVLPVQALEGVFWGVSVYSVPDVQACVVCYGNMSGAQGHGEDGLVAERVDGVGLCCREASRRECRGVEVGDMDASVAGENGHSAGIGCEG